MAELVEVVALLLAEGRRDFLNARCEGDLDVGGHGLVAFGEVAGFFCFFDHGRDALDGFLALLEAACDFLGEGFDLAFLLLFYVLVVEPRKNVLGV